MDNEVMDLIEELYSMVSEAWGVPLGNDKCIVERDKVLNMIEDIKAQLPVELSEAKRLVSARDEFIGNAKREAESIRRAAEEKARAMVEEQEISIVIVSSPTKVAPTLVLPIINAGIKGVLNFTSTPLNFPQGIIVENYDITTLLEKVAYFVKENEENSNT